MLKSIPQKISFELIGAVIIKLRFYGKEVGCARPLRRWPFLRLFLWLFPGNSPERTPGSGWRHIHRRRHIHRCLLIASDIMLLFASTGN
jgi:hypothetical protein